MDKYKDLADKAFNKKEGNKSYKELSDKTFGNNTKWEESKHPRDDEGKFASVRGDSDSSLDREEKALTNHTINAKVISKTLKTKKDLLEAKISKKQIDFKNSKTFNELVNLPLGELNQLFEQNTFSLENLRIGNTKKQDLTLKSFLKETEYLEKPMLANKDFYNELIQMGATLIYRGVKIDNYQQQLRDDDDVWIGKGIDGNGLYFSPDEYEAMGYSKGKKVASALVNPRAKVVEEREIRRLIQQEYGSLEEITDKDNIFLNNMNSSAISLFAVSKGYDIIMSHGNYLILNRNVLIMEEDE